MTMLKVVGLTKRYVDGVRAVAVLDDVSLTVDEGEFVGLWGPRRSGKSTLLRVIAGLEPPDGGEILLAGQSLTRSSTDQQARARRVGGVRLVASDWRRERPQSVIEHVALPLLSQGMSLKEAKAPAHRMLEVVGVAHCAYWACERLSRAEQLRASIARELVHEPGLLLIDEPLALLRPNEGAALMELLRSLNQELRCALMFSTEDVAPLRSASRILTIDRGRLRSPAHEGVVIALPKQRSGSLGP